MAAIWRALGHSKLTTTMRCRRPGTEENAALLAANRFFAEPSEAECVRCTRITYVPTYKREKKLISSFFSLCAQDKTRTCTN